MKVSQRLVKGQVRAKRLIVRINYHFITRRHSTRTVSLINRKFIRQIKSALRDRWFLAYVRTIHVETEGNEFMSTISPTFNSIKVSFDFFVN